MFRHKSRGGFSILQGEAGIISDENYSKRVFFRPRISPNRRFTNRNSVLPNAVAGFSGRSLEKKWGKGGPGGERKGNMRT